LLDFSLEGMSEQLANGGDNRTSLAKSILRGVLWNHAGKILEYALMYVFSVLVARGLGAEQNGIYVTFYTLAQFLLLISGLGFETALTRWGAQFFRTEQVPRLRYVFRRLIGWRLTAFLAVAILCYFFRLEILRFLSLSRTASEYFLLLILYAGLRCLIPLFIAVFVSRFNTRIVTVISVSARALEVIAAGYLLSHGYGLETIFLVIIGGAAYSLVASLIFARRSYWGEVEREDPRPVITLGATFWLNTIMAFALEKQGDIFLLNNLLGDRREVSYYDVAFGLMQVVVYGFTIGFSGVSLAVFSRVASSNPDSLGQLWKFSVKVIALLVLPPLIFLAAHAKVIIPAIYSSQYAGSIGLFQVLVLFQITARLFGSGTNADILLAVNKPKVLVAFGVLAGGLNILLDILLIPPYRAYGAVIATGIANTAVVMMSALYIVRRFSVFVSVGFWLKIVAISAVSALVGRYLLHPETVVGIVLSALIYVAVWILLMYVFKLFSRDDIDYIKKFNFQLSEWASHFALT
jgi:O-antigen/teichoic acid export membrane protein